MISLQFSAKKLKIVVFFIRDEAIKLIEINIYYFSVNR